MVCGLRSECAEPEERAEAATNYDWGPFPDPCRVAYDYGAGRSGLQADAWVAMLQTCGLRVVLLENRQITVSKRSLKFVQ